VEMKNEKCLPARLVPMKSESFRGGGKNEKLKMWVSKIGWLNLGL
jgi:hypothetical protein